MTVYGYRPPEENVPWFGEGGTIPTVLGEVGSDLRSLFIDPLEPFYQAGANMMKPPEERTNPYPKLGHDLGLPYDQYGNPIDKSQPVLIGDDPGRGSSELSFRSEPRGLLDMQTDALEGVGALSEFTPLGMLGPAFAGLRTKKYLGYPEQVGNAYQKNKMRGQLEALANEGILAKDWYPDSGGAFVDSMQGDIERAKQLASFGSITSPSTNVKTNMGHALRMYYQNRMGDDISAGLYPNDMAKTAYRYLKEGEDYLGPKRSPFFNNIMQSMDPNLPQLDVTNDMWMARAFGYGSDDPGAPQHRVMTAETQRIADKMGLKPHQVQASIWSAIKGRWEHIAKDVKLKGAERGWSDEMMRDELRKEALKADIPEGVVQDAGYSFKDAMKDYTGYVGWEAVPSRSSGLMPQLHDAPYEVRMDFSRRIDDVIGDSIEKELGIPTVGERDAWGTGFYIEEGIKSFNPSRQIGIVIPMDKGGVTSGRMDPSAKKSMELYSAIRGKLTNQDSVGYGRSFAPKNYKVANQVDLDFGRALNREETESLMDLLETHPDLQKVNEDGTIQSAVWFAPTKNGVRVNHDVYGEVDRTKFVKAVQAIVKKSETFPDDHIRVFHNQFDGDLAVGGKNGEGYDSIIRRNGGEAQERKLSSSLTPKIQEAYKQFAKEQGWPDQSGTAFPGQQTTPQVGPVLSDPGLQPLRGLLDEY